MNNRIVLFEKEEQCSGCGACVDICHQKAISMYTNEEGFCLPKIDENLCVRCGMCKKVCGFQNEKKASYPLSVKAATAKNEHTLIKSASGGVFAELAKYVLRKGGVVFGAAMFFLHGVPIVKHIEIDSENDLDKLQGSKYVQSDCQGIYAEVKKELNENKIVLFSGTPCQVASLKRFLGREENSEKLILVDLICHGVPSLKMFQDYIVCESNNISGNILSFKFRDKSIGWGMKGRIDYSYKNKNRYKTIPVQLSSYYSHFLNGNIYRKSCYECVFACKERVSDITIGDYWKFGAEHPDQIKQRGGAFEEEKGISCILLNTEKGYNFFSECTNVFKLCESTFDKVARVNMQLKHPSIKTDIREYVMQMYIKYGYKAIDEDYYRRLGKKKYIYIIWNAIPPQIRKKLKQITLK